jgi:diaminohydroxyphosphoribosylaminopyrimidine deaminase/5-amino-6-(5-phosphoribosylamino)uracil reductase
MPYCNPKQSDDIKFMRRALELAQKGAGHVSPNPMVGCVIVRDGRVISEGYHQQYGQAHAEVNAIESATEALAGSTIYVTLEPCSHSGKKTPPCAPRIVNEGFARAVIATSDPNPQVNGNGIRLLREAGIEVRTGTLQEEALELNRFFNKHIQSGVPWVSLKIARSQDGFITARRGEQTWITGEESRAQVHKWRGQFDATLVGAATVRIDDPQLNVRAVNGRDPFRVIIDGRLTSPTTAQVFTDAGAGKTILFTAANRDASGYTSAGARVVHLPEDATGRLRLDDVMKKLMEFDIASVLVEGGADIYNQFIEAGCFDEILELQAPHLLNGGVPAFRIPASRLRLHSSLQLGPDTLRVFRRKG